MAHVTFRVFVLFCLIGIVVPHAGAATPRGLGCLAIGGQATPQALATHALLADPRGRNVAIVRLPVRTRRRHWIAAVRDDFSPYWLDTRWRGTPVLDIDPNCPLVVDRHGRISLGPVSDRTADDPAPAPDRSRHRR